MRATKYLKIKSVDVWWLEWVPKKIWKSNLSTSGGLNACKKNVWIIINLKSGYDKKVAVLMGGNSSEREVSLSSGKACFGAIKKLGYITKSIDTKNNFIEELIKFNPDVVFNALHGKWGEDGTIQGVLESLNFPYTHSGVLASAVAMDKDLAKIFFKDSGIPVVQHSVLKFSFKREDISFSFPYVVKPLNGGSSLGVKIFRNSDDDDSRRTLDEGNSWQIRSIRFGLKK